MNIALKECAETKYWIRLLQATDYIDENQTKSILTNCTELEKMLTKIVKTTSIRID